MSRSKHSLAIAGRRRVVARLAGGLAGGVTGELAGGLTGGLAGGLTAATSMFPSGALAQQHKLPTIHGLAIGATSGGLMAYGPNDTDYYRLAAEFVDRILRGAKPADLPMQQPTKWELVINLKTAGALGVTVPKSVLQQAERMID